MLIDLHPRDEIHLRLSASDVRVTHFIQFLDESRIVVEQTRPEIDNTALMSLIFFTYRLHKNKNQRIGFQARIENITPDRRIFVRRLTQPFICDLRLWPRVQFDLLPEMHAFCRNREIKVVDVSGGGTQVALSQDDPATPAVGSLVQIRFLFEKGETTADGQILRIWIDRNGLRHVEIKFLGQPEIRNFIYKSD